MPANLQACLGRRMGLLRPKRHVVDPRFLSYVYLSPEFQEVISQRSIRGATVDRIPLIDLPNWEVRIAPLSEQDAIASVLSSLDDKIALQQRVSRLIIDLMKCRYAGYGADQAEVCIADIAEVFDGPHATPAKTLSGPWFLSISSLDGGRLALDESAHLSDEDFQRWTRRVIPREGDLLFSYETRLGEAALMPPGVRACLGRRMALLRPRDGWVGPRVLLQAFLSATFQRTIQQRAVRGATVDRIPLTELPNWPIPIPTGDSTELEELLADLDRLAVQQDREIEALVRLRDALLPKLMSGEIRVREAEKIVEAAV